MLDNMAEISTQQSISDTREYGNDKPPKSVISRLRSKKWAALPLTTMGSHESAS
ncbi:hypothetical protein PROSTU_02231 [Providencia stuartii ATCC 25827]|uniref:Uncharacterized protein n=1 Tax=Providencia stuartii ATCC 25827 TaxID=471874 RepID=A0AA86YIM7_PROST|nr:hypothetical protein PROSTU_02231 [Providencia stuartii ATCC 25827]